MKARLPAESRISIQTYKHVIEDVIPQHTAMMIMALVQSEGFGEKRIKRVLENYSQLVNMIEKSEFPGGRIETDDILEHVQKKYNIDLSLKQIEVRSQQKVRAEKEETRKRRGLK